MAITVAECDDMIALAEKKGVHLVASPGQMIQPYHRRIRKLILNGAIGRLVWAAVDDTIGNYHLREEFRGGVDVLTNVDPTWYYRKPGGGPLYDSTVYSLHTLTGILGPASRVTAMSGLILPEREFRGKTIECDMDDSTLMLLDFGESVFAFVGGTVVGGITRGREPSFFGTGGKIIGTSFGEEELNPPGTYEPHVLGQHARMPESHVFEDLMQLVDWIRDGTPSIASAEHARHVIDIIEASYRAAETGQTQELHTSFAPLPIDAL